MPGREEAKVVNLRSHGFMISTLLFQRYTEELNGELNSNKVEEIKWETE